MNTSIRVATSDGYIFRNGKLKAYKFIEALVDFESGEVKYTCRLGGKKATFNTTECPIVYDSEKAYQDGNGDKGALYHWSNALSRVFSADCYGSHCNETGEFTLWMIKDNTPTPMQAPKSKYLFKRTDRNGIAMSYKGDECLYKSKECASLHCDLIRVDDNGVEYITKSAAKKMLLDDEQQKAIEAIKDSIEKAKSLGVNLIYDRETCDVYAFSRNSIKSYFFDLRDSSYGLDHIDLLKETGISMLDVNTCECGLYVDWK